MRIIAGILMMVGGFIGGSFWFGTTKGYLGLLTPWIVFPPSFFAFIGGYYALKRERWKWALTGAICSLLFPFFGIPALILLIKRKGEFQG